MRLSTVRWPRPMQSRTSRLHSHRQRTRLRSKRICRLATAPNGQPVATQRWPVDATHLDASRAVTGAAAVRTPVAGPLIDRRAHKHRGNAELARCIPGARCGVGSILGSATVAPHRRRRYARPASRGAPRHSRCRDGRTGQPAAAHERLLQAAVAHGEQRCRQGVSDEALLGEYHALRKALWRHLLHSASATDSLTTIFRVDVVISAASGLALRGFTRGLVPADFPWERELARAMTEVSENLSRALV